MAQKNVLPVLEQLPFAVDTYTRSSACKIQFSTHAHKDHLVDITSFPSTHGIFCTALTKQLILMKYPELQSHRHFHTFDIGDDFELPGVPGGWRVSVLEANHCPGAAMLLFYGLPGCTILHSGDCRLTREVVTQVGLCAQAALMDRLAWGGCPGCYRELQRLT